MYSDSRFKVENPGDLHYSLQFLIMRLSPLWMQVHYITQEDDSFVFTNHVISLVDVFLAVYMLEHSGTRVR